MSPPRGDLRISSETRSSSAVYSTFSSSPLSYCTVDTPRSMSPMATAAVPWPTETRLPSPKPLAENPEFIPIDQEGKQRSSNDSSRPIFENPRPAPSPPKSTSLASTSHIENTSAQGVDVCDEAEDFLQFLSKAGFMAADRRTSSVRRGSAVSTNAPIDSRRGNLVGTRRTRIAGTDPTLHPSRPSSLILDSRRTSLALRRSSLPPILQDDPLFSTSDDYEINPRAPPSVEREDTLSKMLSQMRMSSNFSLASSSSLPSPSIEEEDPYLFSARKRSSFDFTDLEILLARTRNPILTHLHRTYTTQFEILSQQIADLTRQVEQLKLSQQDHSQQVEIGKFDREISLDVYSATPSDQIGQSRSVSQVSSSWRAATMETRPVEPPFWRDQLLRAGEEWDQGGWEGARQGSLRCISPMTKY
jgi:hypothetical protein